MAACALALAAGCKKKEDKVEEAPPPRNVASLDVVNTEIGGGLAIRADGAPTSIEWERVIVLDDDRAVLLGRENDTAWVLRTADRGRTWHGLNAPVKAWSGWGVAADGSIVLATGQRERPKDAPAKKPAHAAAPKPQPIIDAALWFAGPEEKQLNGPRAFFPDDDKLKGIAIAGGIGAPALLDGGVASLLVDRSRDATLAFASSSSASAQPLELDKSAGPKPAFVPIPYGRPPKMLAVRGPTLLLYPWPKAGEKIGSGAELPGFRADATTLAQLSEGPSCEWGAFAFRRLAGPQPWAIGVGGDRAMAIKLPAGDVPRLGCSSDAVVVETTMIDPNDPEKKRKVPQLVRCAFDGKCSDPKSPPYAIWSEKHDRTIWTVPTSKGLVAVMRAKAGSHWGLYLGQSNNGGESFELPRTIGEGRDDKGYLELGALIRFPQRIVMLISASVGSSGRRGWYALASDDEGNNWGPP